MSQIADLAPIVCAAVAEEIRDMRAHIDTLAETLASDEYLACTYTEHLQTFDFLAQLSEEVAVLLERVAAGACLYEAIEKVRLDLVQNRLRAALEAI